MAGDSSKKFQVNRNRPTITDDMQSVLLGFNMHRSAVEWATVLR